MMTAAALTMPHPHLAEVDRIIHPDETVAALMGSLDTLARGCAPEAVHRLRAATRRLEVYLGLSGWRMLRDDLRWLRQRAAVVRDCDILLALDLPSVPREQLEAHREIAEVGLVEDLSHPRVEGLRMALAIMPPLPGHKAIEGVPALARQALAAARRAGLDGRSQGTDEQLHRSRKALKRLRYALEWAGEGVDAYADLRDALGRHHDLSIALSHLDALPEERQQAGVRVPLVDAQEMALQKARACYDRVRKMLRREAR